MQEINDFINESTLTKDVVLTVEIWLCKIVMYIKLERAYEETVLSCIKKCNRLRKAEKLSPSLEHAVALLVEALLQAGRVADSIGIFY
jgi:hypothetical protein